MLSTPGSSGELTVQGPLSCVPKQPASASVYNLVLHSQVIGSLARRELVSALLYELPVVCLVNVLYKYGQDTLVPPGRVSSAYTVPQTP